MRTLPCFFKLHFLALVGFILGGLDMPRLCTWFCWEYRGWQKHHGTILCVHRPRAWHASCRYLLSPLHLHLSQPQATGANIPSLWPTNFWLLPIPVDSHVGPVFTRRNLMSADCIKKEDMPLWIQLMDISCVPGKGGPWLSQSHPHKKPPLHLLPVPFDSPARSSIQEGSCQPSLSFMNP